MHCRVGTTLQGKDPSYKGEPYKPTIPCPKDKLNQSLLHCTRVLKLQAKFGTSRKGSLLKAGNLREAQVAAARSCAGPTPAGGWMQTMVASIPF